MTKVSDLWNKMSCYDSWLQYPPDGLSHLGPSWITPASSKCVRQSCLFSLLCLIASPFSNADPNRWAMSIKVVGVVLFFHLQVKRRLTNMTWHFTTHLVNRYYSSWGVSFTVIKQIAVQSSPSWRANSLLLPLCCCYMSQKHHTESKNPSQ